MGFGMFDLLQAMSGQVSAKQLTTIMGMLQKGQYLAALIGFLMIIFALMLYYMMRSSKSTADDLRTRLDKVQDELVQRMSEQHQSDMKMLGKTTEAITAFNLKIPEIVNFMQAQATAVSHLSPGIDRLEVVCGKISFAIVKLGPCVERIEGIVSK